MKTKEIDFYLPRSDVLDIDSFEKLFSNATTSYKFIYFLALLEILKHRNFDVKTQISFTEITVEMLVTAWFPYKHFNLSFGTQDTMTKKIDELPNYTDIFEKGRLRQLLRNKDLDDAVKLTSFVPYRILSPFLKKELVNVDKGAWMIFESAMPAIVNANFEHKMLMYKFDSDIYKDCTSIFFSPIWANYLQKNFAIIHHWTMENWAIYMQKRNPQISDISKKLV
jgi:hypothetical protein